jgi:hypothetical protein
MKPNNIFNVKGSVKKQKKIFNLSIFKVVFILIVVSCLVLAGFTPTFNSIFINNKSGFLNIKNEKGNEDEYKKTSSSDDVWAHASFYWEPQYPDPKEEITFYSSSYASNGHISSTSWEFDDGHRENGLKTTYYYEKKGRYKVTLRVTAHGSGGFDSGSITKYVAVGADPFPRIKYTPAYPSPGDRVKLDGSDSKDPDGSIVSYRWSYYDIKHPEKVIDLASDIVVYYSWSQQGIYIVSLFTEDNKGNNNTLDLSITVSILKLSDFDTLSRDISFKIINSGNITAKNVKWNVEIFKVKLLGTKTKSLYQKGNTISALTPHSSKTIDLKDIRRKICRIKVVITAEADNALKITKTFYGRIIGKFVYLTEEEMGNPLNVISKLMMFFTISFIISVYIFMILTFFPFWFI